MHTVLFLDISHRKSLYFAVKIKIQLSKYKCAHEDLKTRLHDEIHHLYVLFKENRYPVQATCILSLILDRAARS